jgi:hypothetical protein
VRSCVDCQSRLEEARFVTDALEELPHFAPSHDFADRVMAQVPVYIPWHVAARDLVRDAAQRWMPRSRPARLAVLGSVGTVAAVLTIAILWVTTQTDFLIFATGIASTQLRELVVGAGRNALTSLLGAETLALVARSGLVGLSLLVAGFLVVAAGATFGLRAIALNSSRRRG